MKFEWEPKFGPASIIGALGIIIQAIIVIWAGSAIYTKMVDRLDAQGSKIEEVVRGSDERFKTIREALSTTRATQTSANERVGRLETALSYISEQVKRVETRLDGSTPPAPALPLPKP